MKNSALSIDKLPALPRDEDGPVFSQPWEAKAFALAVRLSEAGVFTWPEWVSALSREIKAAQDRRDPDQGDTYYQHWLKALESICAAKGLVGREDLQRRKAHWRLAYLNTPHGQPIDLSAAFKPEQCRENSSSRQ
jgi:nitrile hydratase accessory protein